VRPDAKFSPALRLTVILTVAGYRQPDWQAGLGCILLTSPVQDSSCGLPLCVRFADEARRSVHILIPPYLVGIISRYLPGIAHVPPSATALRVLGRLSGSLSGFHGQPSRVLYGEEHKQCVTSLQGRI